MLVKTAKKINGKQLGLVLWISLLQSFLLCCVPVLYCVHQQYHFVGEKSVSKPRKDSSSICPHVLFLELKSERGLEAGERESLTESV